MTVNAQSLKLKRDELKEKARQNKPLIIGVTETWANEDLDDGIYKLDSNDDKEKYVMYRGDRVIGGGDIIIHINATWTEGMSGIKKTNKSGSI